MKNNDWQQIETIFHTVLELDIDERTRYLSKHCAGDESVRSEIESLLASFDSGNVMLEETAFDMGMQILEANAAISLTGQQIGIYKILDKIGSGGMGEVYAADDTRLNRRVALKFLSPSLVDDRWAKRQLFKEAQAVAGINHPNICPVYGIEEIGTHSFIVMQYIEGSTLSNLIRNGGVEEKQCLSIFRQITEALAAAHENRIIHRDIKAGNIMLDPKGQIKVLDFGLAKTIRNQGADEFGEMPSLLSQTNAVVGTIAYMSPEQLRAEKLDYRTDIFSLGVVFYELLSGSHPFLRNSDADTMSAILNDPPKPISGFKNGNALAFNRIIKKCLEKDKDRRFQSTNDLVLELQSISQKRPLSFKQKLVSRLPVAAMLLVIFLIIGAFVYQRAVAPRSLAILPFVNQSENPRNDFMKGMAETLIGKLSNSSQINVKPYTLVANYKTSDVDPVKVGQTLNVDAVLTGRLLEQNNQLVLETNLINIADGNQLWSENNVLNESDALDVQNNISENIISKLQSSINSNNPKSRGFSQHVENPEAYKFYLQGMDFYKRRDKDNIEKAIDAFNQAVAIDPDYARAHAGLAYTYVLRANVNYNSMRSKEARTMAQVAAKDAIRSDDNLCESHAALAVTLHKYDWNWLLAEQEYQRAIQLNPEYAQSYYWYSDLLAVNKRFDEAIANSIKARDLDPFSAVAEVNVARIYYYARQYDKALEPLKNSLNKDPNYTAAKYILGLVYVQQNKYDEATKIFEELYASDSKSYAAALGFVYGKSGRRADALRVLNELEKESEKSYVPAQEKAIINIGLGDKEAAFLLLEKGYQDRFAILPAINVEPLFDDLRDDPRFKDLLTRMNLNNSF